MKVILRADVEKLGRLGDIVQVRGGYGRNCLLPKGLAMPATPSNLKVFELERKKLQAKMEAVRGSAADLAGRIEGLEIRIAMRVGDNDKLYGSVTAMMIAGELAKQGIEVDRHRILMDGPIRTLGEFELRARLHADVSAGFLLKVVPEERIFDDNAPSPSPAPQETAPAEAEPAE
ncbi:MAG: 50S ribosomal protein L9 [Desulfovibrionaceae bacterium]|nr:50S ribosomal protein L9 [Desulfovibrionaceae bacterium]